MPAILADRLTHEHPGSKGEPPIRVLDGVSFSVPEGSTFALLGPNGAGKSTTVRILVTLLRPTGGTASVAGHDVIQSPRAVRQLAGVALQDVGLDLAMTPHEILRLQGTLFGLSATDRRARADTLLQTVGLADVADRPARTFSGGMRRRLDLAVALVHRPRVLFLDEPTTGLDPASRRDVWAEVERLRRDDGVTVFLTTQYLEEADALADHVAILSGGQIAAEGTPDDLKRTVGEETVVIGLADAPTARRALATIERVGDRLGAAPPVLADTKVRLPLATGVSSGAAVPELALALAEADVPLISLTVVAPTLDDVFLRVTGLDGAAPAAAPRVPVLATL